MRVVGLLVIGLLDMGLLVPPMWGQISLDPSGPPPVNSPVSSPVSRQLRAETNDPEQVRLVGKILNSTGQAVTDATLELTMNRSTGPVVTVSTQADERGGFELTPPTPGRWKVTVQHPDYETIEQQVWLVKGLTTPLDIVLTPQIRSRPRTRLGVIGVGTLETTRSLSQRLAVESLRLQAIPLQETVIPLDALKLQPVLQQVGIPLYELLDRERPLPDPVGRFFDYLGLKALVVARVDILSRRPSATEITLNSRSQWELWTLDDKGQLSIQILDQASQSQTEAAPLRTTEMSDLYQIQVTRMATEIQQRWQVNSPLAAYFAPNQGLLSPQPSRLDTTLELRIPAVQPVPSPSPTP